MNEEDAVIAYFREQRKDSDRRCQLCQDDGRSDEANFEKIESSVIQLFQTVYEASLKQGDAAHQRTFMQEQLQRIPMHWQRAYQLAANHDDPKKMLYESIKIKTAQRICQALQEYWEESR